MPNVGGHACGPSAQGALACFIAEVTLTVSQGQEAWRPGGKAAHDGSPSGAAPPEKSGSACGKNVRSWDKDSGGICDAAPSNLCVPCAGDKRKTSERVPRGHRQRLPQTNMGITNCTS